MNRSDLELALKYGRIPRRCLLHYPQQLKDTDRYPVVVMLHGAGGTAEIAARATRFNALADREKFITAFPQAVRRDPDRPARFLTNPPIWNDGSGRGHAGRTNVDDVGFIRLLLDELVANHLADPSRIFIAGFSNGGSMTFRLGMELSHEIAAIAVVAGSIATDRVAVIRPLPLIYIAGDADPLNPPSGGSIRDPWGGTEEKPPIAAWPQRWAEAMGGVGSAKVISDANGVRTWTYDAPAEVRHYQIEDAGHVWPGGHGVLSERITGPATHRLDASAIIWDFFRGHPMPPHGA